MTLNIKKWFLLLTLSFIPLASWAHEFNVSGNNWVLRCSIKSDGTAEIKKCERFPEGEGVAIPSQVYDEGGGGPYTVTSIGDQAFLNCSTLASVEIPNSVTTIGDCAFYNCSRLGGVEFPNSLTTIGENAFFQCSNLNRADIPNSVTTIGVGAFSLCTGLTSVTIPNSVTTIGDYAFMVCTGLTSVTIPNSVTTIGSGVFWGCLGLSSVTIPNSVTSIGSEAFCRCEGLTSATIGNSVNTIGQDAFSECSGLKTVYNLSTLGIGTNFYGLNAYRVVNCTVHSGSGVNVIYKIPDTFAIVDNNASNASTEIPRSTIPTNFIYIESGAWKAENIVLTDDTSRFEAPVAFTAAKASYSREFANSNRSTLCLPFTAAVPEGFEVYDFAGFNGSTISFSEHSGNIAAYTPYLVGYDLSKDGSTTLCTITQSNAVFPQTSTASPACTTTYSGMTFKGTVKRTCMTSNNYGYRDGFFVQSGNSFDHSGHAHVNPFRAYFAYTAPAGAPQNLPSVLNVEVGYGDPVGIDAAEAPEQEYDGRYGNDVYDMLGRLVRKNADNLEGLPRGIYIWKGKKVVSGEW